MTDFFKKLWSAPFPVKLSFAFLAFVLFCILLVDPGKVIFTSMLLYAVFTIMNWLADNE